MCEQLSHEAKDHIRKFVFRIVLPSGIVSAILMFVIGFLVNNVAQTKAERYWEKRLSDRFEERLFDLGKQTAKIQQLNSAVEMNAIEVHAMMAELRVKRDEFNGFFNQTQAETKSLTERMKTLVDGSFAEIANSLKADHKFLDDVVSKFDQRVATLEKNLNAFSNVVQVNESDHSVLINGKLLVGDLNNEHAYVSIQSTDDKATIELFGKGKKSGIRIEADPTQSNMNLLAGSGNDHNSRMSFKSFADGLHPESILFQDPTGNKRLLISSRETSEIRFWGTNDLTRIKIGIDNDPVVETAKFELEDQNGSTKWYRSVTPDGVVYDTGK